MLEKCSQDRRNHRRILLRVLGPKILIVGVLYWAKAHVYVEERLRIAGSS
jgi:hypothetical protein